MLHNLSWPYNDCSINNNIPQTSKVVKYANITDAINLIHKHSPKAVLAKTDIKDAFRLVPLNPKHYHLTGFMWDNKYYFDKCLPQGLASSCQIFEAVSDSLKFAWTKISNDDSAIKILDDFLFVAKDIKTCDHLLNSFLALCNHVGVPIADHKTVKPTHILTFLGIEIDTINMIAALPKDKLIKYKESVEYFLSRDFVYQTELRSLLGKLQFATIV